MKLFGALAIAIVCSLAHADKLSWTLPTTRENGDPLDPNALAAVMIYRDDITTPFATMKGTTISYIVPSCLAASYTVTVIDRNGLESKRSDAATLVPNPDMCTPKTPSNIAITPS